ncbi:MAG: glycosyltransferase family 4 protein [Acidobacteria bacterium]|nr:glycosyltransferase family 4 protein [Acidobacteriota bacterium]
MASALAEHASVLLLLPEGLADPFIRDLDKRVSYRTFSHVRLRQPLGQWRRNRWLLSQVRQFGADVLHVQQGSLWFNVILYFEHRVPVVLTVHDAIRHTGDAPSAKTPYFFWRLVFRRADRIIAQSCYVRDQLRFRLNKPLELIHVIPHPQLGQRECMPSTNRVDGRTILFFGRIWPYKGLEYLIRAEPWITEQLDDITIVIAGIGEDIDRYRQIMVHPEHFVILNRHISEEEAAKLFQETSVVVLPYIEASQSGVIPMAYTHSRPVVASAVGGLPEMVLDGVTGVLVPPRDERKLAEAIITLLANDTLRQSMGAAGKEMIKRECSPAVIAAKTIDVYRLACRSRRQGSARHVHAAGHIVS